MGSPRQNANPAPASGAPSAAATTPFIDVKSLQSSYTQMVTEGSQPKIFTDMFGMMLQVVSKQTENEQVKEEVKSNSNRIKELEAKVGGPECISEQVQTSVQTLFIRGWDQF